jgi:hypothetical protein
VKQTLSVVLDIAGLAAVVAGVHLVAGAGVALVVAGVLAVVVSASVSR